MENILINKKGINIDKLDSVEIDIRGINIDVRSENSLYIEIGDYTYYIDDSTGEQIVDYWKTAKINI